MRRTLGFTAVAAIVVFPVSSWCQQPNQQSGQKQQTQASSTQPAPQQDSLAAAARKAKEQKKESQRAAKVFTNDNIPSVGGISAVGSSSPAADSSAATTPASAADDEKTWRDRFAKLHHKLDQDKQELDVMQRELGVLNVQYYSDPLKAMQQQYSRSDINEKTAKIDAKKKEIEADQQAINDAEDELRKAGGDPGWAR